MEIFSIQNHGFSLKKSDGACRVLDNIYAFSMNTGNTGCLCIKLGNTKFTEQGSMVMIKASLYNYTGLTEFTIGYYMYPQINPLQPRIISNSNPYLVNKFQLGKDANGDAWLILGTNNTDWKYTNVLIDKVFLSCVLTNEAKWRSGWTYEVRTDFTGWTLTNLNSTYRDYRKACFRCNGERWIEDGDTLLFESAIFNMTQDVIYPSSGNKFTVKYDGYIMISFTIWLGGLSSTARPWVQLYKNTETIADCIGDSSANFVTFSIANRIVNVSSGDTFCIKVYVNDGNFALDAGTAAHRSSYITFELI